MLCNYVAQFHVTSYRHLRAGSDGALVSPWSTLDPYLDTKYHIVGQLWALYKSNEHSYLGLSYTFIEWWKNYIYFTSCQRSYKKVLHTGPEWSLGKLSSCPCNIIRLTCYKCVEKRWQTLHAHINSLSLRKPLCCEEKGDVRGGHSGHHITFCTK